MPANTAAVSGDPISSTKFNTLVQDLESDANVDRPVTAGGTGASTAAGARTNLGLVIGTDVQAYNVKLADIAALTATDGGFIVGDGSTFVIESGATARTSLGLGTAAIVNTGTSGATIPLLNGANTWSNPQTIAGAGTIGLNTNGDIYADRGDGTGSIFIGSQGTGTNYIFYSGTAFFMPKDLYVGAGNSLVWHAGNDGAGSGLDADTLDGVQGSGFANLASANTFTAADPIRMNAAAGTLRRMYWQTAGTLRWAMGADDTAESGSNAGTDFVLLARSDAGAAIGTALTVKRSTMAATFGGTLQARVAASTETTGTLTSASANKTIQLTGDITINNSVFSAGDIIVVYAGSASRSITAGTITTMRLGGSSTTGTRTLAARGLAVLFFVSATEVVVSGGAVT